MKTDISIPDNIFNNAESLAETMGISRNELYANALQAYIQPSGEESNRHTTQNEQAMSKNVLSLGYEDDPRDSVVFLSDN